MNFALLQYVDQDDESSDDEGMLCEFSKLKFLPWECFIELHYEKYMCWLHFMYGQKVIFCNMHRILCVLSFIFKHLFTAI
jgi:hypothetical protein